MEKLFVFFIFITNLLVVLLLTPAIMACSIENEVPCQKLDIVEKAANDRFWSKIWEFEKEWYNLNFTYTKNKNGVHFYSQEKICKKNDYSGERVASLLFILIKQTPREHHYQILHSACGNDNFLKETWKVRGTKLPSIDWKKLILEGRRKFSLNENETYKESLFEASAAVFNPIEETFPLFPPTKAPFLMRTVYEKKSKTSIDSILSLFGENIFLEKRDFAASKIDFNFLTPSLFYRPRLKRFSSSECYASQVNYFFAKDHREIRSSGSTKSMGLSLLDFNNCLNTEVYRYFISSEKILKNYYNQFKPDFKKVGGTNKSEVLKAELKQIISYVQNSNLSLAIELLKSVLANVESEKITDKRVVQ